MYSSIWPAWSRRRGRCSRSGLRGKSGRSCACLRRMKHRLSTAHSATRMRWSPRSSRSTRRATAPAIARSMRRALAAYGRMPCGPSAGRPGCRLAGLRERAGAAARLRACTLPLGRRVLRDDGERARAPHSRRRLPPRPRYIDARLAAANAASRRATPTRRSRSARKGSARRPFDAGLLRALGRAHLARRDGSAAADAFARALTVDMTDGETHYNHGVALQMQRQFAEAARAYQRALLLPPRFLRRAFQPRRAVPGTADDRCRDRGVRRGARDGSRQRRCLQEPRRSAARRRPDRRVPRELQAVRGTMSARAAAGRAGAGRVPARRRLREARPLPRGPAPRPLRRRRARQSSSTRSRSSSSCCCTSTSTRRTLLHLAQRYDEAARRSYGEPLPVPAARRPGRLRIGYLSGDLRNHVMGKMVWAAVEHHDKARFELFFYSLSEADDEWTARFRGLADAFRVLGPANEREAALAIAADDLDVLVDLSTHTKGARPGILAHKPARVQITHIASAGTVGLCGDRLQADRRLRGPPREPGASRSRRCCRWTAACIRIGTSRRRRNIRSTARPSASPRTRS